VIGITGLLASGLLSNGKPPPAAATQPSGPRPYGLEKPSFGQVSSASCAAAACHGGGHPGRVGSEHSTWAATVFPTGPRDPHADAYRVLSNADSVRIGKLLGIAEPHGEALCLKCHAVDGVKPAPAVSEGVGCGACHGPAEKWLAVHVQPGWKSLSNRTKWEQYGFAPAGNLVARTLNCVGCHVGDADREVNHDLIAAGHPRLNFEYTRFHFSPGYQRHWRDKTPQPDFEVRAWVVGQAATLRAATELLRARAERAATDDPNTPWPEFSGLSCYACHQQIGTGPVRRESATTTRPAGLPGWEVWSNGAAGVAAKLCHEAFPGVETPRLQPLEALKKQMEKRSPDPKAVAKSAAAAVAELDAWLAALQASEDRYGASRIPAALPRRFAHALSDNALSPKRVKLSDPDWDALAANYLGCAAMYHAAGGRSAVPAWTDPVRGLTAKLRFPPAKPGRRFDSPAGYGPDDLEAVRKRFGELYVATEPRGKP
jgi:hypothetical protein